MPPPSPSLEELRRRAVGMIAQDYHDPSCSPVTISRMLYVSRRQLSRSFEHDSLGPGATIAAMRVEAACVLIAGDPARALRDVAVLVGFADPQTFRAQFATRTGVLPSEFRAMAEAGSVSNRQQGPATGEVTDPWRLLRVAADGSLKPPPHVRPPRFHVVRGTATGVVVDHVAVELVLDRRYDLARVATEAGPQVRAVVGEDRRP
ncbi:AraC family transcriptional regulator [Microbacterium caowuchunii]|nr:AraC family transcriptional regulator [Microbacterium caowuchunii]